MGYDGIISFRPGTRAEWLNYDQVLARGEGAIETDTGIIRVGDGSTKYSLLAEYKRSKRPVEYDISSSDVEIVLEDLHGGPQDFACSWSGGDGTYKIKFKLPDGTYSEYEGEGTGKIRFEATEVSGNNKWKVVDYKDMEDWHNVGDTGEPAFENGWVNYSTAWVPARFKRYRTLGEDIITLQFMVKDGTDVTVWTLPVGYRPVDGYIMGFGHTDAAATRIYVATLGSVAIANYSATWSQGELTFRVRR